MSFPLFALFPLLVIALLLHRRSTQKTRSLPPGPPSDFFLGTRIPQPYAWRQFERWTHEYGPVCTVWLGRNPAVIVGTYAAAMEILEKNAGVTSDRPLSVVAGETLSGGKRILLVKHGERWRRLRKVLHQGLQPKSAASYEPIQEAAARTVVRALLADPDGFPTHLKTYAASVIMTIAYGKTTPTKYTDPQVIQVNASGARLGAALRPGVYLVDAFPILRFFPGKWKRDAEEGHRIELALFRSQLDTVREGMKRGDGADCFGRYLVEHQQEYGLNDDEAAYAAGSMFGAGSDTTASALSIAIMAAACYPKQAKLVQEELDRVIGRERSPVFSDEPDLPILQAFVKEVFRWRPVSSGGFAHQASETFSYQGYVIPKGTQIIGNHWSISRDPEVFPNPNEFRLQRWFVMGDIAKAEIRKDVNHVGYGFGRRICAGQNVANRSMYINCALLLWAFDFAKKRDAAGRVVEIDDLAFTDTANSHPLPFEVSITPRFPAVDQILES